MFFFEKGDCMELNSDDNQTRDLPVTLRDALQLGAE